MTNTRPIHEVRVGKVKAAIFENQTQYGTRRNCVFSRIYKNADNWARSESFSYEDMPVLARVVELAQQWLCEHEVQESTSTEQD